MSSQLNRSQFRSLLCVPDKSIWLAVKARSTARFLYGDSLKGNYPGIIEYSYWKNAVLMPGRRDSVEPIMTYRLTDTGLWSYHFYEGRRMIGKASSAISLSAVVRIETDSISWYSSFRINTDTMA